MIVTQRMLFGFEQVLFQLSEGVALPDAIRNSRLIGGEFNMMSRVLESKFGQDVNDWPEDLTAEHFK